MSKFYCNKCDEDVVLENGMCPKCKTNWGNIIKVTDKLNNDLPLRKPPVRKKDIDDEMEEITYKDIADVIVFFLSWASFGKFLSIFISLAVAVIAIVLAGETQGLSLFLFALVPLLIFIGFVFENSLKWKAYMLYTNSKNK